LQLTELQGLFRFLSGLFLAHSAPHIPTFGINIDAKKVARCASVITVSVRFLFSGSPPDDSGLDQVTCTRIRRAAAPQS
jgi:hypothetical protein